MKPALFALVALAGCSQEYGRVWVTNAAATQPAEVRAQFGGQAPVSSSRNPVFGDCYGTTTSSSDHYSSAGTLQLSGGGGPWQLAPDTSDSYLAKMSTTWVPGTALMLHASGAEVPAFTGTFVVPPALVYDVARADLETAIAGNGDVTLRWSPIDAESIWVGVQSGSAEVSCSFKGEAGAGTIPGAALATLPAYRTISSVASNSEQLQLGSWWVNLLSQSRAQLADGSLL